MQNSERPWVWILDQDSEFRTFMLIFASHFHYQIFDLSNLTEAEQSFLFYREYVRHYPAMHCLRGVIALAAIKGSDQDRVQRLFSEITRDFPDVKTIQLGEKRPQSIAELFNLFEQFKK